MNKKNGFTLVELLTVVTIVAVLIILMVPIISRAFRKTKTTLDDLDKNALIDSGKLYINNIINNGYNVISTNHYDSSCNFINTTQENKIASYVNNGEELTGYKFIEYAATHDLYVTAEYLVNNDYFDSTCSYDTSSCEKTSKCKVDKECTLVVHFDHEEIKANPNCTSNNCEKYYTLGNYTISIQDESKCKIK